MGIGDFNGEGKSDLVLQNQTTNQICIWYMNGTVYSEGVLLPYVPEAPWKVVGVGDFNGDGFMDLALQNQTTHQTMIWYLYAGYFNRASNFSVSPPPGWKIVGPR